MSSKAKYSCKQIVLYFIFILFALTVIYPIFWIVTNSFKVNSEFYKSSFDLPKVFEWRNYVHAWSEGISRYYLNSVIVTAISVMLIIIIATLATYAITRLGFKYQGFIMLLLLGGMFVSPQSTVLPLYNLLRTFKMYDTYAAMIVPIVAFRISFSIFLLYPAFKEFPREIEEAAVLDGCNKFQIYYRILLPTCKPAVMSCGLLNLIYAWNEFTFSINFITNEEYYTIPVGLMSFSQALYTNWVVLMAGIVLSIIPVLVVFVVFQKYFITGLTAGSVKE